MFRESREMDTSLGHVLALPCLQGAGAQNHIFWQGPSLCLMNSMSRRACAMEGKETKTGRRHTGWSRAGDEELGGQSEIQVSRRREQKRRSLRMGETV